MLKGVPPVISPDLMHVLMKMGHGDELVIADGNFPADSKAQQIARADGLGVVEILEAVELASKGGGGVDVRSDFIRPEPMDWAR